MILSVSLDKNVMSQLVGRIVQTVPIVLLKVEKVQSSIPNQIVNIVLNSERTLYLFVRDKSQGGIKKVYVLFQMVIITMLMFY